MACEGKRDRQNKKVNMVSYLLTLARRRAKVLGREFNLEPADIVIPSHCPILGIPLATAPQKGYSADAPSLDRKDNTKGYIKGNVAIISMRANTLKGKFSKQEGIDFAKALIAYLED
jgi:hypothetical protein